jgi:hypothetical protein
MTFFDKLLDKNAPESSGRFLSIVTVLTVLYTWMFVSIYTRMMADIPAGVYTFAGLVIGGKAIGMFAEAMGKQPPNTTTTIETASKTVTGDTK